MVRDMAALAARSELSFVHVVCQVATATVPRNIVMHVSRMAGLAGEFLVTRRQSKVATPCMIKIGRPPVIDVVTALAVGSITTFVHVIGLMAGITIGATAVPKVGGTMTIGAADAAMTTVQAEASNGKVIEGEVCPRARAVTIHAVASVATFMNVIILVACDTSAADIAEIAAFVTGIAGCRCMSPGQGKSRDFMIKVGDLPIVHVVAGLTGMAKPAFVWVVVNVAVHAV